MAKEEKHLDEHYNTPVKNRDEELENNKSLSEIERHIQKSIHDGVLDLRELIPESYKDNNKTGTKTKNEFVDKYLEEIIAAIEKYPIHKHIMAYGQLPLSKKEIAEVERPEKNKIIADLRLEYQMYNEIESLTPDYFHNLMKENKYEDVLIELCRRLEIVLKGKYKYKGKLMDMAEKLFVIDDGEDCWLPYDKSWWTMAKLIRCRDNAIKKTTTDEVLTSDELEWCINYICNLA